MQHIYLAKIVNRGHTCYQNQLQENLSGMRFWTIKDISQIHNKIQLNSFNNLL